MKNVVQDLTSSGVDWQREKWQSGLGSKFIRQGEKNAVKYADEIGVYALHAAKVSKIPVRIFHAHGASITKDWKLPIKLVCKAMLPANMNEHYSCGVEAARCYFGNKVVSENDYVLIPNAIKISNFVFNELTREKIRRESGLEGKLFRRQQFRRNIKNKIKAFIKR